jgi:hypothetical protein
MLLTTVSSCCGEIGAGWWLWMSMTGNFARGTGCSGRRASTSACSRGCVGGGNSGRGRPRPVAERALALRTLRRLRDAADDGHGEQRREKKSLLSHGDCT